MSAPGQLEPFRRAGRRGFFLDYDGTLAEIAARPELALPVPGVSAHLARLAASSELVAVVSGRAAFEVRRLIPVERVEVFGHYGLSEGDASRPGNPALRAQVERAVARVEGAWVEDKGPSLAVHYRAARDPSAAAELLGESLGAIARDHRLILLPGKMVLELAPLETPGKGAVILAEARRRGLDGCLYAGDDASDLAAFEALVVLSGEGVATVRVAVRSEETPQELLRAADVVVERPAGLLELLGSL